MWDILWPALIETLWFFVFLCGGILFWAFVTAPILQALKNARARDAK